MAFKIARIILMVLLFFRYWSFNKITLDNGEIITATSNHPFWEVSDQNWKDAGVLNVNSTLINIDENNISIVNLKRYTKNTMVYNLTVANDHTYFVGLNSVLGHNSDEDWYECVDNLPYWKGSTLKSLDALISQETFARGYNIYKVKKIVKRKGGNPSDWKKRKGEDEYGQEWHWYERKGIDRIYAKKRKGDMDPSWEDW